MSLGLQKLFYPSFGSTEKNLFPYNVYCIEVLLQRTSLINTWTAKLQDGKEEGENFYASVLTNASELEFAISSACTSIVQHMTLLK